MLQEEKISPPNKLEQNNTTILVPYDVIEVIASKYLFSKRAILYVAIWNTD